MRSEVDIIEWGIKICVYLDSGKANEFERKQLSWILGYRRLLNEYEKMAILFDMTTKEVRNMGITMKQSKFSGKRS